MKYIHEEKKNITHVQWLVMTSRAESLMEISNWVVGWSRVIPSPGICNPGVCIHIQNDDSIIQNVIQHFEGLLRTS